MDFRNYFPGLLVSNPGDFDQDVQSAPFGADGSGQQYPVPGLLVSSPSDFAPGGQYDISQAAPAPSPPATTLLGYPLAQLQPPQNVYPNFTVNGLLTDTPGVVQTSSPYPDVPPILGSSNIFNQAPNPAAPLSPSWSMFAANDVQNPAQQQVLSDAGTDASSPQDVSNDDTQHEGGDGTQDVALKWYERPFVTKDIEANVKTFFNGFTGGALTPDQTNKIYNQVIQNIELGDAKEFRSINPNSETIVLTPVQMQVVQGQIKKLSPDLRDVVQPLFEDALSKGRLSCPSCKS